MNNISYFPLSTMHPTISFLTTNKGKPLLILDQYMFKCNKTTSWKKYWICCEVDCDIYVHTDLKDQFISISGDHDHVAQPDVLETKVLREKMKNRILSETTSITKIYDEELTKAQLSDEVAAEFPTIHEYRTYLLLIESSGMLHFRLFTRVKHEQSSAQENAGNSDIMCLRSTSILPRNSIEKSLPIDGFLFETWNRPRHRVCNR